MVQTKVDSAQDFPTIPGHLFVVHGSLENIEADAILVPADSRLHVESYWRPVTSVVRPKPPIGWAAGYGKAIESRARSIWYIDVTDDTYAADIDLITDRLELAIEGIVRDLRIPWTKPVRSRAQHLVALPLLGTGEGGIPSADMVKSLLDVLRKTSERLRVDIAIVVKARSMFDALRWRRRQLLGPTQTPSLGQKIGDIARRGELALMIGAGVSMGAGLPSWDKLIEAVAAQVCKDEDKIVVQSNEFSTLPVLDRAELLERILGDSAARAIVQAVTTPRSSDVAPRKKSTVKGTSTIQPALGHFLLAGLRCSQVATTNYDLLYEQAVRAQEDGKITVLPEHADPQRHELVPARPWILKLHGDASHPEDLVLSRSSFFDYDTARQAVGALFQSMLMTHHVLFVGLSFTDDNVLRLIHHVAKVRQSSSRLGTVLALGSGPARERLWQRHLDWISISMPSEVNVRHMPDNIGSVEAAWQARELEIILDGIAMWAVDEHDVLLDPEITEGKNPLNLTPEQLAAGRAGQRWLRYTDPDDPRVRRNS